MKIRCELHLDNQESKLILVAKQEEKIDHLALKLAAYVMFSKREPIISPSTDHPNLMGIIFQPDMVAFNVAGEPDLWVECGFVTLNKLDKLTRRYPKTRIIVLKGTKAEADRLREQLEKEIKHASRIEIWYWPQEDFKIWVESLQEKTEIFGEAGERTFNLVINEVAISTTLLQV